MSALSVKYESFFINMVLSGCEISEILREAATVLGTPIRFSPENRIDLAICSPSFPKEDIEYVSELIAYKDGELETLLRLSKQDDIDKPILIHHRAPYQMSLFCHVLIGLRYFGNITIPQGEIPIEKIDLDLVYLIAKTIALSCSVKGNVGYNLTQHNLLLSILSGTIKTKEEVIERFYEWQPYDSKAWKLICASVSDSTKQVVLFTAIQKIFPAAAMTNYLNTVVAVIDVTQSDISGKEREYLQNIARAYNCPICISLRFYSFLECRDQLICLMNHPRMIKMEPALIDYADNLEYALFHHSTLDKEYLTSLLTESVRQVIAYDQENDSEYYPTLKTYLDVNCSTQAVAERMHTHKNTILYRMSRIEELFGFDLHDRNTLFYIELGIRALDYWIQKDE